MTENNKGDETAESRVPSEKTARALAEARAIRARFDSTDLAKDDLKVGKSKDQAVARALTKEQSDKWLAENGKAVHAYNEHAEDQGVFGDNVRSF